MKTPTVPALSLPGLIADAKPSMPKSSSLANPTISFMHGSDVLSPRYAFATGEGDGNPVNDDVCAAQVCAGMSLSGSAQPCRAQRQRRSGQA